MDQPIILPIAVISLRCLCAKIQFPLPGAQAHAKTPCTVSLPLRLMPVTPKTMPKQQEGARCAQQAKENQQ